MKSCTPHFAQSRKIPGLWLFICLLIGCASRANAQYSIAWPEGRLDIEGTLRLAWHHRWLEENDPDPDFNKNRFYVQRARLKFSGWQYDSRIQWEIQFELRGYNGLEREPGHEDAAEGLEAKDLHVSWVPSDQFTLRVGQFKVPYGRKQLVPLHSQSLVKRGDISDSFLPGRDRGLMLRMRRPVRDWTVWLGVFTGNGPNRQYDDPVGKPLWAARLEWQPLGELPKEEGDRVHHTSPRLLLGLNTTSSEDAAPATKDEREYKRTIDGHKRLLGGDATLVWRGWFLFGEFDRARFEPRQGRSYDAGGWTGQLSHSFGLEPFSLPGWIFEPVISWDEFNPSHRTADDTERTLTLGFNLMPDGHNLKLMLNHYHRMKLKDADTNPWKEDEIRAILQLKIR